METIDVHVEETDPFEESGVSRVQESPEKYAYYRRCTQLRKNGEQCKGPAMKGESVCYSHFNQAELARFRERQRQNLLGALANQAGAIGGPEIGRAMHKINSAVFHGHIDAKTAGKLILEIQKIIMAGRARERARRDRG